MVSETRVIGSIIFKSIFGRELTAKHVIKIFGCDPKEILLDRANNWLFTDMNKIGWAEK